MYEYLERCKPLSLTALAAISLLVFEKFCRQKGLLVKETAALLDYLWQWPLVEGPDQFEPWEAARPPLVDCGLGDEFSQQWLETLSQHGVDDDQFRTMLSGITAILWGNFWGAADHQQAMDALASVITASKLEELPIITPFKFSLFVDGNGWGARVTHEDRDFWRTPVCYG